MIEGAAVKEERPGADDTGGVVETDGWEEPV